MVTHPDSPVQVPRGRNGAAQRWTAGVLLQSNGGQGQQNGQSTVPNGMERRHPTHKFRGGHGEVEAGQTDFMAALGTGHQPQTYVKPLRQRKNTR